MKRFLLTILLSACMSSAFAAVHPEVQGIAVTPEGYIWISVCAKDKADGTLSLLFSEDEGSRWKEARLKVDGVDGSALFMDGDRLRLFYAKGGSLFMMTAASPGSVSAKWDKAVKIGAGIPTGAVQSRDGVHVLPVMMPGEGPSVYVFSGDGGGWKYLEGPRDVPELQKAKNNNPGVFFADDGSLNMVVRSFGTAWSYVFRSGDMGKTWSSAEPFCYNPDSDFAVGRPDGFGSAYFIKSARYDNRVFHLSRGLYAYLTSDWGKTWYGGLRLDAREGATGPRAAERNGTIYVAYTFHGREKTEIMFARTSVPAVATAWGTMNTPPAFSTTVLSGPAGSDEVKYTVRKKFTVPSLKVATYNIEFHGFVKTPRWEERVPVIKQIVEDYGIELMGTQEPDTMQVRTLLAAFGDDWGVVFTDEQNPSDGSSLPWNPVFFRKSRLELLNSGYFEYNDKHGTAGWDSWTVSRLCTWAMFRDRKSGKEFCIFNSHVDHRGLEAKAYSPVILKSKIQEIAPDMPVLCTGDFNFNEKTEGYRRMISDPWLADAMLALPEKKRKNWEYFSMSKFKPMSTVPKSYLHLDHIFYTTMNSRVLSWELITYSSEEGVFGSDHLPVAIDWQIGD